MTDDLPDEFEEHMREEPDPQLDPERSPGMHSDIEALEDIEVDRDDVDIGEATPAELAAADTEPVENEDAAELLGRLAEGDHVERRRAALALAEVPTEDAVVVGLARAATGDEDSDVRQFAVEALTGHGGERAAAVAVELLEDPDPWVRAEAVVALDNVDRTAHEADLVETLETDDHHAVKRNAAISLFKIRGAAMADQLLELSRADSERLREWAAHMLGGVDEDRARDRLAELTDDPATVVAQTAERSLAADPRKFRREFGGALENESRLLPGEDRLNRMPDL
ncbi:HEAT repeat domain-containing protein [Haloarcula salinisoli]|uniref:HEAT repeat domain-containing protein n=1 Tax=Haloarcula salinisoli TaxID=2487746 RepID=A0A8J7YJ36_9EURY|nr:HEAT repeat domain-containing protein [Halomicroarcula salinisoli]MBX0286359.1 HEAT repeat domain-containing protein [Halomicroarcula salinisoli]MBX0302153.1 HEAT repeat domain-containing protein [Halomicroarcula salinisoli]